MGAGFRSALTLLALLPATVLAQAKKPRVLVYYDMEGISGISRQEQTGFNHPEAYQPSRKFLTGDVNAAIRGLVAGGAGEIVVVDAHGSGNPDPDILVDEMDKRATLEYRDTPFDPYRESPDRSYQAIVCIGMHARANTPGFLSHTFTIEPSFKVNGLEITETEIIAHSAARFGVPVIMVSGDDVLQRQIAERFPLAEYGLVKHARGKAHADVLPEDEAWKNIEQAAQRAIEKLPRFKPYQVASQYQWEMGWQNADQADLAAKLGTDVVRASPTAVGYTSKTFIEGYDRAVAMIGAAGAERTRLLFEVLRNRPDGQAILNAYRDAVVKRWLEPAPAVATAKPKKTRYHGDN